MTDICSNTKVVDSEFANAGQTMRCVKEADHAGYPRTCFFAAETTVVTPVGDPGCASGFQLERTRPAAPQSEGGSNASE